MRYKVGDKVRVKKEMYDGFSSAGCSFVSDMEDYRSAVVTICDVKHDMVRYLIEEDDHYWYWVDDFFEDVNQTFAEGNAVLLRNGQIRLVHNNALYLPNGTFIEVENYKERKHNFDENFDIVEVHRQATGNYLFDLSGELIQEEM